MPFSIFLPLAITLTDILGSLHANNIIPVEVFLNDRISNEAIQMSWNVAASASAKGTLDCVPSWLTNFRDDLPHIDVPTLIIHGDSDRILPFESTAKRLLELIKGSRLVVIPDGPHAIDWTHADQVNPVLLDFLKEKETSA